MGNSVLVVDDSAFMRKMLSQIINKDDSLEVVDTAVNGEVAYSKIKEFKPDIITLDIEMPVMDGLTLLKKLKADKIDARVVVISALAEAGSKTTVEALALGALDVVHKPSGSISVDIETISDEIVSKIKSIARLKSRDMGFKLSSAEPVFEEKSDIKDIPKVEVSKKKKKPHVMAIGISTGGPRALRIILPQIPKDFPLPILIVQHIPKDFVAPLAESLSEVCHLNVKEASDGESINKGTIYIAPGDKQMGVRKNGSAYVIALDGITGTVSGHVPSADYLFDSILDATSGHAIAAIMTGMGSDGAKAIHRLNEAGAYTVAQNQETCTVFGMPRVAIGLNAADAILSLEEIIPHINSVVHSL